MTADEAFVLDGSVIVEIVIEGRHARGARALLEGFAERGTVLLTAAHGVLEAASALRNMTARGALAAAAATRAVEDLGRLEIVLDPPAPRLPFVWAMRNVMSAYDAAYAATARELGVTLLTVDGRLLRACRAQRIPARHLDELAA